MSLLDIVDIFSNSSLLTDNGSEKRQPKTQILFYILTIPAILGIVIELNPIFNLLSPIWFIGLFVIFGLLFTLGAVILFWKMNLIDQIYKKDFIAVLIPITMLTISGASFINRNYGLTTNYKTVVISDPQHGTSISKTVVNLDGEDTWIRIPKSTYNFVKKGDLIEIQKTKGLFGFEIISGTTILSESE